MNEKDDIILEALDRVYPTALSATPLHWNIENRLSEELNYRRRTDGGFSLDTLRNRVDRLKDIGLIEVVREKGNYLAITEEGRQYLRGGLDASELED